MGSPGLLGRVHIEAGSGAEIVAVVFTRQVQAPWAGVRADNRQAQLRRQLLGAGFLHEVLVCAGQPREPVQHRYRLAIGAQYRRRQENRKFHRALQRGRGMAIAAVFAVKTDVGR